MAKVINRFRDKNSKPATILLHVRRGRGRAGKWENPRRAASHIRHRSNETCNHDFAFRHRFKSITVTEAEYAPRHLDEKRLVADLFLSSFSSGRIPYFGSLTRNTFVNMLSFSRSRKIISLEIIEEDSYEKDALFYVELGEPLLQGGEFSDSSPISSPKSRDHGILAAVFPSPFLSLHVDRIRSMHGYTKKTRDEKNSPGKKNPRCVDASRHESRKKQSQWYRYISENIHIHRVNACVHICMNTYVHNT